MGARTRPISPLPLIVWLLHVPQESGSGISRFQTRTAVTTIDAQPLPQSGGLVCYATGNIIVRCHGLNGYGLNPMRLTTIVLRVAAVPAG